MKPAFADSHFFMAMLNPRDQDHARAVQIAQSFQRPIVTTQFVLLEVGDACARPVQRPLFEQLVARLAGNANSRIIAVTSDLFDAGLALFVNRPDKDWSLTNCSSFSLKQQEGITDALTADHHFEQAGFVALLR